ncbi:metalloregulator ArsR/SmtB family transcription factor [Thermobifida halotolerans]|uniref:Metalloregulator ArsR/SmtB family transcription factor n=1 Tax=Thermobifida halotolerans TaxID=483545 RepID=A0A399G5P3_9ACTN|nr:metalloregulator ArsR/SmtB family transcription factor [Thermobifida halotolerans]UOE19812.1 metalloregulator ArsR/SmtB family transcription factor [Thermobifida halotolerans]
MGEFTEEPIYAQLARLGKALSSPVRLRLLDLLDQREHTVEELAEAAGVPLKNTSAQLQRLREVHLVAGRREGSRVRYRLADPGVSRFLGCFQEFAEERLADLRDAVAEHLGDPAELRPMRASELRERLDDPDLLVLDVRAPDEYAADHVPGAVSVPMEELRERLAELPEDVEIVAYCQGPYCVLSPTAVRVLRDHGRRARTLDGGFTRWRRT